MERRRKLDDDASLSLWIAGAPAPFDRAHLKKQAADFPQVAAILARLLTRIEAMAPTQALEAESLAYAELQGGVAHRSWLAGRTPMDAKPAGAIQLERQGGQLHIQTNRPGALNAIDRGLRDALHEAFTIGALDAEISSVHWTAAGKAFSVGADLNEFGTTRDPARAHEIRMQTLPAIPLIQCGGKVRVVIQGACIGAGLEMAAFAGHISASPNAWFQLPELAMGLIPGAGGCVSVSRRIGIERTALLVLSGKRINANTALEWGLIDAITN